jgi:chemotaxis protein CheZ
MEGLAVMKRAEDADLVQRIRAITPKGADTVDAAAVTAVVEAVVASLSGDLTVADLKLYHELEQLSHYIQAAKREIAALRPRDISEQIPAATDELDAVVEHTAEATGTILDVAEGLEKLAPSLPEAAQKAVGAAVTRIYEACNFQDISGQRITKVVKTLKFIDEKIDALLAAFGVGIGDLPEAPPASAPQKDGDAKLMAGPQLPKDANKQAEIDALLAELDRK